MYIEFQSRFLNLWQRRFKERKKVKKRFLELQKDKKKKCSEHSAYLIQSSV